MNPLERNQVDEDYAEEYEAAVSFGHEVFLYDFEKLHNGKDASGATKKIPHQENERRLVYRGWMLRPSEYELLYNSLLEKNFRLVNSPTEYRNCHYLPDSLKFIGEHTPKTVWLKLEDAAIDFSRISELLSAFGNSPLILKDYVKSQKHNWETACFIPDPGDTEKLASVVNEFVDWQGDELSEGLVFREYIQLEDLSTHSKSGMPLKLEYRLFFYEQRLIYCCNYWEEGEYDERTRPPLDYFSKIAARIESNFFTMDIAKTKSGDWIIIELGDAQVAGLPLKSLSHDFYANITEQ